jgi:hypothetical protein
MTNEDIEQPKEQHPTSTSTTSIPLPTVNWDPSTESIQATNATVMRPKAVEPKNRQLSMTSSQYDHDGKGYLDPTEQALRNMDEENKGFLDTGKMHLIMETLQTEQKKSAALIQTIQDEHKKTLNLKKGLVALCCLALMLALANIGTAFAAAILSKDTTVSRNNDFTTLTGEVLGTTSKNVLITMQDVSSERRRHLQESVFFYCSNANVRNTSNCYLAGEMTLGEADKLYQSFCPDFPESTTCTTGGVEKIILNCNGRRSTIFGGADLPEMGPTTTTLDKEYTIYPTQSNGYATRQIQHAYYGSAACPVDLTLSIYCPTDGSACAVMGYMDSKPDCATQDVVALCADSQP